MHISQVLLENKNAAQQAASFPAGGIGGWLTKLFGCRHKEISRPFSIQGQAYRTCLDCGARRQFNLNRWEMQGHFYYRLPATSS